MNDQFTMFPPTEVEVIRDTIRASINAVAVENWLDGMAITEERLKSPKSAEKWSFRFYNSVIAGLFWGKVSKYITILAGDNAGEKIYLIPGEPADAWLPRLRAAAQAAIDQLPNEFSCCSQYAECSDAMQCIHPDKSFARGCFYRKQMARGIIFYGKNRNID